MEWDEEFLAVEVERELAKSNQNQLETKIAPETKGCGCTSIFIALILGIFAWRLILEIFSFIICIIGGTGCKL